MNRIKSWRWYRKQPAEKRWDLLQRNNRLSYDHADNWICGAIDEFKINNEAIKGKTKAIKVLLKERTPYSLKNAEDLCIEILKLLER